jgi:hypothetical protein
LKLIEAKLILNPKVNKEAIPIAKPIILMNEKERFLTRNRRAIFK